MWASNKCSYFFFEQIVQEEKKQAASLPLSVDDDKRERAGYHNLIKTFGAFHDFKQTARRENVSVLELMTWEVSFYHATVQYNAWENTFDEKYRKILQEKDVGK